MDPIYAEEKVPGSVPKPSAEPEPEGPPWTLYKLYRIR
jgi:hypothetical protein